MPLAQIMMTMRPVPVAVPAAVAVPVLDLVKPQATHTETQSYTQGQMGNLQPGSCLQHVLIILHA